nr:UDP-N-acetylmuramoyl-L-alanine--D-glutamate ligase [Rhodococcus sp. HNM0569]
MSRLRGESVLVTGAGVSGRAVVEPLRRLGAQVTVTDARAESLAPYAGLGADTIVLDDLVTDPAAVGRFALVVTSPGFRPDSPVLAAATAAGVPVWGDIEFTWHVDRSGLYGLPHTWLVVTGTNGKTTTTSMLASILDAAGLRAAACGNIGLPVLDAIAAEPRVDVLAVELSSFQLYWAPSLRPDAGAVLNIAEDHLDWHGGMQAYVDAKARALTGRVAVVGLDDPVAAGLARTATAPSVVGFRLDAPVTGEVGVADGALVDAAFADHAVLTTVDGIEPPGAAGLLDALAAATLARAAGVDADAVHRGLHAHRVGPHRGGVVAERGGVRYVDDSKATNPHAARPSILAHDRVVWVAGGQLKGAAVDELVTDVAERLAGVVLLGVDAAQIAAALARHAPRVPVVVVETGDDDGVSRQLPGTSRVLAPRGATADDVMARAVGAAASLARPGDTVLLAPAAASLDMFTSYGHRGDSFADAARRERPGPAEQTDGPGTC